MPMVVRSVASLLLGVAFLMLGNGALSTLIGLRLAATDSGATAVGMITAAYYAGLTLGSLYAHRIITRVGHIRSFSALASVVSVASLSHALFVDASLWAVLRLTQGFCMAGLYMCIESWLNGTATNESRGQLLSAYMVTLYGASGLGQQLLRLDDETGIRLFMIVSILLTLALVPVALTRTTPPQLPDVSSFGIRRLYQSSPLGVAGVFISGAITGSIYGLAPVFEAIAVKTVRAGDQVGQGTALKLAANAWIASITDATGQSLAIARALGLDPALFLEAIDGGPVFAPYAKVKGGAMLAEDWTPSFEVDGVVKDLGLMVSAGAAVGFPTELLHVLHELFAQASGAGHGADDMAAVRTVFP